MRERWLTSCSKVTTARQPDTIETALCCDAATARGEFCCHRLLERSAPHDQEPIHDRACDGQALDPDLCVLRACRLHGLDCRLFGIATPRRALLRPGPGVRRRSASGIH